MNEQTKQLFYDRKISEFLYEVMKMQQEEKQLKEAETKKKEQEVKMKPEELQLETEYIWKLEHYPYFQNLIDIK